MSNSAYYDRLDLTDSLLVERRRPVPTATAKEKQQLADLREVIHILAMAMSEGKAVA